MSAWILSIVGISIIGVLIELLLTDSPMSKFVRSIYAFFILFVIISPIPKFFDQYNAKIPDNVPMNSALYMEIKTQLVSASLVDAGFDNCLVTVSGEKFYINAVNTTKRDKDAIINIVTAVAGVPKTSVEVVL